MWFACAAALIVSTVDVGGQISNEINMTSGNPFFSFFEARYKSSIIFIEAGRVVLGLAIFYEAFGQLILAVCLFMALFFERAGVKSMAD